jgi:hypothetical protein
MATLYVNAATGNNATTKAANTAGTPWASIGRAVWGNASRASADPAQAASAGDTVIVAAGAYTETSNSGLGKEDPLLTPENAGTSGNPITIQTDGGVVTIEITAYSGPAIGSYQKDYIIWDGFTINEVDINSTSDTGPVVVWQADHCQLKNLVINGTASAFGDNHCGIRGEEVDDLLIQNCFIQDITDSVAGDSENSAGIMFYVASNVTIERCTFTGSSNGIFVKGNNPGPFDIRYNLFYDQNRGIFLGGADGLGSSTVCRVYENIMYDVGWGVMFTSYDAFSPNWCYVFNNTIQARTTSNLAPIRFTADQITGLDNCQIFGNVLVDGYNSIHGEDQAGAAFASKAGPSPAALEIEHNVYHNYSNNFSRIEYTNRNFASWKTFTGTDAASPASVESDPLFIDKANQDFRLNSGSPARMAVPDLSGIYGGTRDAGARQFADNGAPIQIGYLAGADPAPTVTSCSPSSGTTAGGTSVTITGADFVATPTSITFGGSAATSVSFTNSTTLTCVTPAHAAGAVNVVVTNPDAQSGTGINAYTYTAPGGTLTFGIGLGEF